MKDNFLKNSLYILSILIFTLYILYRIFFTLTFKLGIVCFIFSLLLLTIEVWDYFDCTIFFLNILIPRKKKYVKPSIDKNSFPNVDIFIATYNESEDILSNTITKCLNLNYPNNNLIHIYVCDDGNRDNIKHLTQKLNVNYISRTSRKDFKAGNYNNALSKTSSPYIVTLDADMAPEPNFLLEVIPYFFLNKNIGFVQLPQSFTNPDIFQHRFNLGDSIPFEQDYFYNFINLKKNTFNSSIYCGTNAVLSREALYKSNNFATNSITEDIATGLNMEIQGYTGIALDKTLVYGKTVLDYDSFIKQRTRWARGSIQILKSTNILFNKILSIRQKFDYLSCISYWFFGIKKIIYLIAPLLFCVFNIITLDCNWYIFFTLWLLSCLLRKYVVDISSTHSHSSTWNKIHEIILFPILAKEVIFELFGFNNVGFEVSSKNENLKNSISSNTSKVFFTHLFFLLLNTIGLSTCIFKFILFDFNIAFIFSMFFILSNIFYLLIAIVFDISNRNDVTNNFIPNKVSKYSIKSIFNIFTNVLWREK
ncbi:MAG: glycosyltransferase [Clostridia bacterium]|nr:glycosyltransferase [Clostridia bacterium]